MVLVFTFQLSIFLVFFVAVCHLTISSPKGAYCIRARNTVFRSRWPIAVNLGHQGLESIVVNCKPSPYFSDYFSDSICSSMSLRTDLLPGIVIEVPMYACSYYSSRSCKSMARRPTVDFETEVIAATSRFFLFFRRRFTANCFFPFPTVVFCSILKM